MRACFVLCAVEEFNYAEVAAMLGLHIGSVKVSVHRARAKLRGWLAASPAWGPQWMDPNAGRPSRFNQWNIALQWQLTQNMTIDRAQYMAYDIAINQDSGNRRSAPSTNMTSLNGREIMTGGSIIVSPAYQQDIETTTTTYTAADGSTVTDIGMRFFDSKRTYVPLDGEIKGLLDSRDVVLPEYQAKLDALPMRSWRK
jgi:hypothetical protein